MVWTLSLRLGSRDVVQILATKRWCEDARCTIQTTNHSRTNIDKFRFIQEYSHTSNSRNYGLVILWIPKPIVLFIIPREIQNGCNVYILQRYCSRHLRRIPEKYNRTFDVIWFMKSGITQVIYDQSLTGASVRRQSIICTNGVRCSFSSDYISFFSS